MEDGEEREEEDRNLPSTTGGLLCSSDLSLCPLFREFYVNAGETHVTATFKGLQRNLIADVAGVVTASASRKGR